MPVALSSGAGPLAAGTVMDNGNGAIAVWDIAARRPRRRIDWREKGRQEPTLPPEATRAPNRQKGSTEDVSAVAFSPDGRLLAAGVRFHFHAEWSQGGEKPRSLETEENVVRIWEVSSGKRLCELTGHVKRITSVLLSPDGRALTTASEDGTMRFWNPSTAQEGRARWEAGGPLFGAVYSPDGKLLAAGGRESVLVWEAATGRLRQRLAIPAQRVRSVAFAPSGITLAGAGGHTIRFWNVNTGALLRDAPAVAHPVRAITFSADGRQLFSGHEGEHVVRCWDAATLKPSVGLGGHAAPVKALGFTPDGNQVISSTLDDHFRLWDAFSGRPCPTDQESQQLLERYWSAAAGHTWPLLCEPLLWGYGYPREADAFPGRKLSRLERWPGYFSCSADGNRVLIVQKGDTKKSALVVRDRRKVVREFLWTGGDEVRPAISPDGNTVAAMQKDLVSFFDVATGEERRYDFAKQKRYDIFHAALIKFSPDGGRIVIAGDQGTLWLVSTRDGRLLAQIQQGIMEPGVQGISGVAFSPDGETLTTGGGFGSLYCWETATGQLVRHHRGASFLFSPDNRLVAMMRSGGLCLHDLYSGALLREYKGPNGFAGNFTFSPDGRLLAAACRDTTILVWSTTSVAKTVTAPQLDNQSLERLWQDLEDDGSAQPRVEDWRKKPGIEWKDPEEGKSARAYRAIGRLIADRGRSLPFLTQRLAVVPPADAGQLHRLIADLDSGAFTKREAASRELSKLGIAAEPAVRAALAKASSLEVRKRLGKLVQEFEQKRERLSLARLRAVQVLEHIGTSDAQRVLKSLAEGPDGQLARAAREALQRMQMPHG